MQSTLTQLQRIQALQKSQVLNNLNPVPPLVDGHQLSPQRTKSLQSWILTPTKGLQNVRDLTYRAQHHQMVKPSIAARYRTEIRASNLYPINSGSNVRFLLQLQAMAPQNPANLRPVLMYSYLRNQLRRQLLQHLGETAAVNTRPRCPNLPDNQVRQLLRQITQMCSRRLPLTTY